VIETFIRRLQAEVTPNAVLINKNDLFETTNIPSLVIQGPEVEENKERRTRAKEIVKDTDTLTYEERNYPHFYHFDFDFILTTRTEEDLLDLQERIIKFFLNNPELEINQDDRLNLVELTPMGGLFRPNLSNLRQSSGKYRIEDLLVYDDSLIQGKLIVDRTFEYYGENDTPLENRTHQPEA
jgi:hypothetical protein